MTFKRKVLAALTRIELLEVGRAVELDVTTNMRHDDLLDVVAGSKKRGMMEKILPLLARDTLKAICEAVGISQEGREKQVLIDRILVAGGEAGGDAESEGKTPSPVALRVPAAKPEAAHVARDVADDDEPAEPSSFSLTSPEPKAPKPAKAPAAKARVKFTTGAKSVNGTQVLSYRHADRRKNNPEVGMVDPETDPAQPKTTWAYDPHIDPALQFDVGRAGIERFIDDALASGDEATLRGALEELRRLSQPYLNWTGKAERGSFEVDTVSLHVHERIDPASILGAVRKRMKGEGQGNKPGMCVGQGIKPGMRIGQGLGPGRGDGARPEAKDQTSMYDSRVRQQVGQGPGMVVGEAPGPNIKGQVEEGFQQQFDSARHGSTDPLSGRHLPRKHSEHAEEYFDRFREGK